IGAPDHHSTRGTAVTRQGAAARDPAGPRRRDEALTTAAEPATGSLWRWTGGAGPTRPGRSRQGVCAGALAVRAAGDCRRHLRRQLSLPVAAAHRADLEPVPASYPGDAGAGSRLAEHRDRQPW